MLNKTESPKKNIVKYSLILPLLIAFIFLFNIKTIAQDNYSEEEAIEINKGSNGNTQIKIRDTGTKNGKTPLYIIDGKEASEKVLQNINPDGIESIFALKGNSDTEKYGKKGENGVIIISLKENKDSQFKVVGYADTPNPLIVIDGKKSPNTKMKDLDFDKIESINVIKNEKAIKKYGEKWKNRVIEITTKKN